MIKKLRIVLLVMALSLAGCAVQQPPTAPPVKKTIKLGLALGGGAARGFAHIGVIAALEEAGLKPEIVVGTSAGSVVAALYASGKNAAQLKQAATSMDESTISDWMLPVLNRGVLRGQALARYVNEQVEGRLLENMRMQLGVVATELHTGQAVLFRRGDTGTAVRASSAVPGVFMPVKIGEKEYVDGGLVSPVPAQFARSMGADVVLAVDISSPPEGNLATGLFDVLMQTFSIMSKALNQYEFKNADVVVRPSLWGVSGTDFSARQRAIDAGYAAMLMALPALKAKLER